MPFGIQSAPEVFQRKKHELIQGMPHVEVVADGGPRDGGFKLNMENLKLRQSEVSFIGPVLSLKDSKRTGTYRQGRSAKASGSGTIPQQIPSQPGRCH